MCFDIKCFKCLFDIKRNFIIFNKLKCYCCTDNESAMELQVIKHIKEDTFFQIVNGRQSLKISNTLLEPLIKILTELKETDSSEPSTSV